MNLKPLDGTIVRVRSHELDILAEIVSAVLAEEAVAAKDPRFQGNTVT